MNGLRTVRCPCGFITRRIRREETGQYGTCKRCGREAFVVIQRRIATGKLAQGTR